MLICDDDEDILSALQIYLTQEGYAVVRAENGAEALRAVENNTIHLIMLDIMMPVMDGIMAAVKIREISNAPIIFLSAKSEDTDRILGLNMGGDDYITKPFNPVELLARVRAALRRYARLGGLFEASHTANAQLTQAQTAHMRTSQIQAPQGHTAHSQNQTANAQHPQAQTAAVGADAAIFQTGGLVLDDNLKRVTLEGDEVALTAIEYNILKLLISNVERVYSSAQVYEAVWNEPAFHVSKIVSVHIRNIRKKIEINPKEPQYLKVIYGLGYKITKVL